MAEPDGGSVSTAFLSRLAARTRLRRWSRTRTVLVVVAVLVLVGALVWVVAGSSLLTVRTVQVRGVTGSLAAQVAAHADDQLDKPLARVDLDAVRRSVEEVPGAADVSVHRSWPHTLTIDVTARRPAAVVRADGGGYDVVDPTGVVLSHTAKRPSQLPLVVVGVGPGANAADGLVVLRSAPPAVRKRVQKVDVQSAQDIRLDLDRGVTVRWGSAEAGARKAQVLGALLGQKASVYDVSAPDLPTTRE
jgi:cell division protein FtsQ